VHRDLKPGNGADVRFFGAMMIGIGIIFFWLVLKMEAFGPVIHILAAAIALGAAARIYARITYDSPGIAGMMPIVIEIVMAILLILVRSFVAKDSQKAT
jgi:Na+/phosphate symporter